MPGIVVKMFLLLCLSTFAQEIPLNKRIVQYLQSSPRKQKEVLTVLLSHNHTFKEYRIAIKNLPFAPMKATLKAHNFQIANSLVVCNTLVPLAYNPKISYPLLVSLHGSGGVGKTQIEKWKSLAQENNMIVAAPNMPWSKGYRGNHKERATIIKAIEKLLSLYNIDTRRIFISGYSAGGHCAWEVATFYPHYFAGLFTAAAGPRVQNSGYISNLSPLSIYAAIGAKDDPRLVRNLRWATKELKKAFYKEYPQTGHYIAKWPPPRILLTPGKIYPKKIDYFLSDVRYGHVYWVKILSLAKKVWKPGEKLIVRGYGKNLLARYASSAKKQIARIQAHIKSGNKIYIKTHKIKKLRIFIVPPIKVKRHIIVYINGKKYLRKVKFQPQVLLRNLHRKQIFYAALDFEIP